MACGVAVKPHRVEDSMRLKTVGDGPVMVNLTFSLGEAEREEYQQIRGRASEMLGGDNIAVCMVAC